MLARGRCFSSFFSYIYEVDLMRCRFPAVIASLLLLLASVAPSTAAIVVSGSEVWDGVNNPHAAQGVTLAGNVYTIPDQLVIGSGARIYLNDPTTPGSSSSITFQFNSGGLTFTDSTSIIDVYTGGRFVSPATFTLNMGNAPVATLSAGAGRIVNGASVIDGNSGDSMAVVINSNLDVELGEIDIRRIDSRSVGINITSGGNVSINRLANPDTNSGGDAVLDVNVTARSMTLGDIDTRAFRPDGIRRNGDINLTALAPPIFDSLNALGNLAAQNVITLNGLVNTDGPPTNNDDGDLNLTAVKVVLGSAFKANLSENANFNVLAGIAAGGYTPAALFMNASNITPNTLQFTVRHDGIVPECTTAMLAAIGSLTCLTTYRRRKKGAN
jgi:hypothetical protein